jgi:large subunit ribosomal protein L2
MPVKKFNPITPGTRTRVANSFEELTTDKPEKSLLSKLKKSGGRNNEGHRTVRNRGGGHKRRYRVIDFKRNKDNVPATVKSIEYDPNRTAFIALLVYADGEKKYIIAPNGLKVGDAVLSGKGIAPDLGNCMPIGDMPVGTKVHAIETRPNKGAVLVRSAGVAAELAGKDGKYVLVKLPSSETRLILATCRATVGEVSNKDHGLEVLGKAGRSRWLGRRPRVRGVAMNPVDHPMGGGEGRSSGGHPRSRNGIMAKGQKTRNAKKYSNKFIVTRRKINK